MEVISNLLQNPKLLFWINLVLFVFLIPWTALLAIPGSPFFALGKEVWYVTFISHIALILSALSTLQASRVEIKQLELEEKRDLDKVEAKVDEIHESVI